MTVSLKPEKPELTKADSSRRQEPRGASFCRGIVTGALAKLKHGSLKLVCHDKVFHFGAQSRQASNPGEHAADEAVIVVEDERLFSRILFYGHIGFAEAYLDGYWNTPDIKAVITWFIDNLEDNDVLEGSRGKQLIFNCLGWLNRASYLLRGNSMSGSKKNISEHYDLSNELFALFLDQSMTYSSAKFTSPDLDLHSAQIEKIDSMCRKLKLSAQDHLLEIGTGWGTFAIHAASRYGCKVTSVTISQEQFAYAQERVRAAGLEKLIDLQLKDYRDITGTYDRVVSIEMIEAVGEKYMDTYFAVLARVMKPDALLGLQMITCPDSRYELLRDNVDFIQKYIFPGSLLPSIGRVVQAINRTGTLSLFELEDMGLSYAQTLDIWYDNFNRALPAVHALGFDERFVRKWNYYLKYCSAAFASRNISVVQAVFTRPNNRTLRGVTHDT
jgi:cyclopropane-fatty-acyl-phospholipid synthase